jgi:uncharacterized Zn finger protein (UPF0148 family)
MTYCANCGTALADDVVFCPNCGTKAENKEIIANEVVTPVNEANLTQNRSETSQHIITPPTSVSTGNNRKQFCRNCGNEVGAGAFACTNCGLPPMKAFNFCPSCGSNCHQDAVLCVKCGVQLESKDSTSTLAAKNMDSSKSFCRNCGKEVRKGAPACLNCGLNPAKSRNFCPSCGSDTHNEAVICIKCGTGLVQSQPQPASPAPPTVQNYSSRPPNSPNVVIVGKQKSTGTAFILAFLFGPFGLLYASVTGGVIMIFVGILLFFLIPIIGGLISWIICMIWAVTAAGEANRNAIANANRMANNR